MSWPPEPDPTSPSPADDGAARVQEAPVFPLGDLSLPAPLNFDLEVEKMVSDLCSISALKDKLSSLTAPAATPGPGPYRPAFLFNIPVEDSVKTSDPKQPFCFPRQPLATTPFLMPLPSYFCPAEQPSLQPSLQPSHQSNLQPSLQPSHQSNLQPSHQSNLQPSLQPNLQPSLQPNLQPNLQPSLQDHLQATSAGCCFPSNGYQYREEVGEAHGFRELVIRGCLELENILRVHENHSYIGDLLAFCHAIRQSASGPACAEFDAPSEETRSLIIAFFRLVSCWLGMFPCLESEAEQCSGPGPGPGPGLSLHAAFREWQVASRRVVVSILGRVPVLRDRLQAVRVQPQRQVWTAHHPAPPSPRRSKNNGKSKGTKSKGQPMGQPQPRSEHHDPPGPGPGPGPKGLTWLNWRDTASPERVPVRVPPSAPPSAPPLAALPSSPNQAATLAPRQGQGSASAGSKPEQRESSAPAAAGTPSTDRSGRPHLRSGPHFLDDGYLDTKLAGRQGHVGADTLGSHKWNGKGPSVPRMTLPSFTPPNFSTPSLATPSPTKTSFSPSTYKNSDDLLDGAYMKPGCYDVPKRRGTSSATPSSVPTPPVPPSTPPTTPPVLHSETTWQAALASAESLCKALQAHDLTDNPIWGGGTSEGTSGCTPGNSIAGGYGSSSVAPDERRSRSGVRGSSGSPEGSRRGRPPSCKPGSPPSRPGVLRRTPVGSPPSRGRPGGSSTGSSGSSSAGSTYTAASSDSGDGASDGDLQSGDLRTRQWLSQTFGGLPMGTVEPMSPEVVVEEAGSMAGSMAGRSPRCKARPASDRDSPQNGCGEGARVRSKSLCSFKQPEVQTEVPPEEPPRRGLSPATTRKAQSVLDELWKLEEAADALSSRKGGPKRWSSCLDSLVAKLKGQSYDTLQQFQDDFRRVLFNHTNCSGDSAKACAEKTHVLEAAFKQLFEEHFQSGDSGSAVRV